MRELITKKFFRGNGGRGVPKPTLSDIRAQVEAERRRFVGARPLPSACLKNARLVQDRYEMLDLLPKHGVCAEVGVLFGEYSQEIFRRTEPREFHLIDLNADFVKEARSRLPVDLPAGRVQQHQGNSSEVLAGFPDHYFDWVYIDADHSYESVKKDLAEASRKVKPSGLIVVDDYIFYDHINREKYGVVEAVNEFCADENYEVLYFALHGQMFCNVVLRRMSV